MLQNVNKAQIKIKTKNDNVAGVNLPVFESYQVKAMIVVQFVRVLVRTELILTSWLDWLRGGSS